MLLLTQLQLGPLGAPQLFCVVDGTWTELF